jgi:hypothetical protein
MKTQRKPLANGFESGADVFEAEIVKPANLLLLILLGLLLTVPPDLSAQPVPHHFDGIAAFPDHTITLSLNGSVSNMFSLSGTISSQFMQMFDLYAVEASTNLAEWTRLALLLRTNNNPHPLLFQDTNATNAGPYFYRVGVGN